MNKSRFNSRLLSLLAIGVPLLVACGPTLAPSEGQSPLSTPAASEPISTASEPIPTVGEPTPVVGEPTKEPTAPANPTETNLGPEEAALVDQAKQDLNVRLGVPVSDIRVGSVSGVQWRDSSLGCPQPGMNYLMVITPGYLIKLEANGQTYEYHASRARIVYCDNPQPPYSGGANP